MQHIRLGTAGLKKYHEYLQSDHDFTVWATVLTMNERRVRDVDILDGQINFSTQDSPDRTASVILSDPEGALSFGLGYTDDPDGVLWVNRLVQIWHRVDVPTLGRIDTSCIVGVPTTVSRQGAEIHLELGDKSLLADHGVRPRTFKKGQNVKTVLHTLLRTLAGERNTAIPATKRKLSRDYTVGMGDDANTLWTAARKIARNEMNWRLYYDGTGKCIAEPMTKTRPAVQVTEVLALPNATTSFTEFNNYAKVTSVRTVKEQKVIKRKVQKIDVRYTYTGVATLPKSHPLSEQSLARNGALRTLPLVVQDNALKNAKAVNTRAADELTNASRVSSEASYECMPFFHLDRGDRLVIPGLGTIRFDRASIPLGTGGNMQINAVRWVSRAVRVNSSVATRRKELIKKKKAKKRKKTKTKKPKIKDPLTGK